ncbi:MAG: hypothetical protein WC521_02610 [Bdellovibrionales bacterium]
MNENENEKVKSCALKILGELPKFRVWSDISLGFCHQQALQIALNTLKDTHADKQTSILNEVLNIFEQWKNELGVYPSHGGIFGIVPREKRMPAKNYCKQMIMAARLSGKEVKVPAPWECCPHIETPVGLLWKLFGNYKPLQKYLKENALIFDKIIALLILISNRPDSEYQSSDCIDSALKLADFRLDILSSENRSMRPDAEAAFNRRKQKRIKATAKKEETTRLILLAYNQCLKKNKKPLLKELASITKKSASTVSRCLCNVGIKGYNTKKLSHS